MWTLEFLCEKYLARSRRELSLAVSQHAMDPELEL